MHKVIIRTIIFSLLLTVLPTPRIVHAGTLSRPPSNLGLVGYWPMDEGVGNKTGDASGSGNNGTLSGTVIPNWTNGKHNKALSFSGANYIEVPNSNSLKIGNPGFTFSAWINPSSVSGCGSSSCIIFNKENSYEWALSNTGIMSWAIANTSPGWAWRSTGLTAPVGEWTHFTITYDGANVISYKNGGSPDSQVASGIVNNTTYQNALRIAARGAPGAAFAFFPGKIDDVRIYNRALSATEIARMYSSGQTTQKQVSNSGLVGYWSMNEGRGNKVIDSSGKGNTGTIIGATWADGKRGKALSFDGVSAYINGGSDSSLNFESSVTMSAWVKTSQSSTYVGIVSTQWASPWNGFALTLQTGSVTVHTDGGWKICNTYPVNDNVWHHISATQNATESLVYIDGVLKCSYEGKTNYGMSGYLKIGSHSTFFSGLLDDVRIYNRALSATEIANLYKQGEVAVNTSQNSKLTNGLVGLWSFNGQDISGTTAYDRSGLGNDGTITGAKVAQGKVGQALSFDGSSRVDVPNATSLSNYTNGVTVSMWFKTNTVAVSQGQFGQNGPGYLNFWMASGVGSTNLRWETNGSNSINSSTSIYPNTWYHAVGVYDTSLGSNQSKLYINGSLDSQGTKSFTTSKTATVTIGDYGSGSFPFNGIIDEVRIYNRALSPEEIKQLYNMGK